MLDNEAQEELNRETIGLYFICQLVPPGLHLENNTEQEINTSNDHFLFGMFISDINCTLKLWYHIPTHAIIVVIYYQILQRTGGGA